MQPHLPIYRRTAGIGYPTALGYDVRLLFPVLFLVGIGIVMVYSASSALALKKFGEDAYFLKRQAVYAAFGLSLMILCRRFPLRWLRTLTYPLLGLAVFLLIAVKVTSFGAAAGGAVRWLRFGSISFQPVEFVRFALILYLAYSMSKKGEKLKDFSVGFVPHALVLVLLASLIMLQPDFGSAVILCAITWIMMFVGGVRLRHLSLAFLVLLPAAVMLMVKADYRMARLLSFLNPWDYAANEGYQAIQSLIAFGVGGLWGAGIGSGYQKLFYLPEPHTDFIFSVIGEEAGLIGVLIVVGCYGLVIWRGIRIAFKARKSFDALLATGLTVSLGLQVLINMGVALSLLPTKGLTLPFISYGGTSLLMNMASIGILMNLDAANDGQ